MGYNCLDSLRKVFPVRNFPELPIRNTISKLYVRCIKVYKQFKNAYYTVQLQVTLLTQQKRQVSRTVIHRIWLVFKAGSHRSRQRQRYRSVAVTSYVKVFTQKILAVTEVIFLISSVLR